MNSRTLKDYLKELIVGLLFIVLMIVFLTASLVTLSFVGGSNVSITGLEAVFGSGVELTNNGTISAIILSSFISLIASILFFIAGFILHIFNKETLRKVFYICSIVAILYFFGSTICANQYYIYLANVENATMSPVFCGFSIFCVFLIVLMLITTFKVKIVYSIQEICETAILVALAVVLDKFARIPIQANGGSISFAPIPLFIIAIRWGGVKGFIASSFIFGLITCFIDGYGLQTYPFDYFLALSGYGLVGTFVNLFAKFNKDDNKGKQFGLMVAGIVVGGVCATVIRYIGHMVSAEILYQPITLLDNFIYQSTYVPASMGIAIGGMIVLAAPLMVINRVFKVKTSGK